MSSNTQVHAVPPPIRVERSRRADFSHHLGGESCSKLLRDQLETCKELQARWQRQSGTSNEYVSTVEGYPGLQVSLALHSLPKVSLKGTLPAGTDVEIAQRTAFRQINEVLAVAVAHRLAERLQQVVIRARQGVVLHAVENRLHERVQVRQGIDVRVRQAVSSTGGW